MLRKGDCEMNVYVARQAILDTNKQVVAYELLFRNNNVNNFAYVKDLNPTLDVIKNSFSVIGFDKITEGKKAFINFDEELIKSEVVEMLPSKSITIEILETVEPSNKIIERCKDLKRKGYTIALDDFKYDDRFDELIKYVDIIKIDFRITRGIERKKIVHKLRNKNVKFLAEKIETLEEYEKALEYGYSYFQGYFFCKPVIVSGTEIHVYKLTYVTLLRELSKPSMNICDIEKLVKSDLSLSYKLLKVVNSAHYGIKMQVTSIRNAIMVIGVKELKKWVLIIALKSIREKNIEELVKMSLLRAYFGELLVKKAQLQVEEFDAFLTGLFSLIDVLMNRPISEILSELPISKNVKDALSGKKNMLGDLLKVILKYEKGDWEEVTKAVNKMGLSEKIISDCYIEAIENMQNLNNI